MYVNVHCLVNFVNVELAVDLLHSLARALHSRKSLSVNVRCLNRVYLLLQGCYLGSRLFKGMLMLLLSSEGSLGSYIEISVTVLIQSNSINLRASFRSIPAVCDLVYAMAGWAAYRSYSCSRSSWQ